jgi:CheY-specific phosphatase CheX
MAEQEEKKPVSVDDVVMAMMDQMASIAWAKLGLQPDMLTGKIEANFDEAKTAIDVTTQLAGVIEGSLDESDKRELQNLIRNLRLNYVQKTQGADK